MRQYIRMRQCMRVCVYAGMRVCVHAWLRVCVYACLCICVVVCRAVGAYARMRGCGFVGVAWLCGRRGCVCLLSSAHIRPWVVWMSVCVAAYDSASMRVCESEYAGMRVCECTCMRVCEYACRSARAYLFGRVQAYTRMRDCMCVYTNTRMRVCACYCMRACVRSCWWLCSWMRVRV